MKSTPTLETPLLNRPVVPSDASHSATGAMAPVVLAKTKKIRGKKDVPADPDRQIAHIRAVYARGGVNRLLRDINQDQVITRRLSYLGASVTTDITGDFIPAPMFSASQVRTLTSEFTSYNLRFDLYRVIAIKFHFAPAQRVNTTTTSPPSGLWLAQFFEGTPPSSKADVLSSTGWEAKNPVVPFSYEVVPSNNSDAWLWTGTSASVALTADYGIVMCCAQAGNGTATALKFGTYCVEVVCQFTRAD